jgi:hypothetical protein
MKFAKQTVRGIGLLFAAVVVLSISMAAQQEVSPDHFDDNPVVAPKPKAHASAKQVAARKPSPVTHAVNKPKAAPVQHQSAQAEPATPLQTASNSR